MFNHRILRATVPVLVWLALTTFLPAQQEPKLSEEQTKTFLKTAEVIARKNTPKGVTSPYRLTLSDGNVTHDAAFNYINESRQRIQFSDGRTEVNFKDSYKYDIAAYELAKLLGLGDMMPVTVERKWHGMTGAISWWLPVKMDEATRLKQKIEPPDPEAWNRRMYKKRIFAELVYDTDINLTNALISADWQLWMIDFTRAFRVYSDLREKANITGSKCERHLLERLRNLGRDELTRNTKGYLTNAEIDGVMARRDKIVAMYDDLIIKNGEKEVLFDDPLPK